MLKKSLEYVLTCEHLHSEYLHIEGRFSVKRIGALFKLVVQHY